MQLFYLIFKYTIFVKVNYINTSEDNYLFMSCIYRYINNQFMCQRIKGNFKRMCHIFDVK